MATKAWGAVLFVAVLANGVWWGRGVAPGGASDEPDHFAVVKFVSDHGRLPRYGEGGFAVALMETGLRQRIGDAVDRGRIGSLRIRPRAVALRIPYVFVPQMPYFLNGWLSRLAGGASWTTARSFNALCIAGLALFTFLAARSLFPGRVWPAFVAGACSGLWPQMTFLGSYVNDDAFAALSVSALIAACAVCQQVSFDRRRALALGAGIGLVCSSKPTAMVFLPLFSIWLWCWSRARTGGLQRMRVPGFKREIVVAAVVAIAMVTPWCVRNIVRYGDPTGSTFLRRELAAFVSSLPRGVLPIQGTLFLKPAEVRPKPRELAESWLRHTMTSFWSRFGWMDVFAPESLVKAAWIVLACGMALSLLPRDGSPATAWWGVPRLFALPGLVLLLLASAANTYFVDFQPQGRYLLGCVPALLLQITYGCVRALPRRVSNVALAAFLAFFAIENVWLRLTVLR